MGVVASKLVGVVNKMGVVIKFFMCTLHANCLAPTYIKSWIRHC